MSWLAEPEIRRVLDALGDARFVGGAVRDLVLGRPIHDLDLATPLPPELVMARLAAIGIRTLPTGLAHGTVTALTGRRQIEITTLRRDVETDGRHAIVAFTDDWAADAARRDFTMNALYLDRDGTITDPIGGLADCRAGRVRFIGDAHQRILEDGLRLLRFYRFQAHYGRGTADPAARQACRDLAERLDRLPGERVRVELFKLLAAPDPVPSLGLMIEDGILARIVPVAADLGTLAALVPLEPSADPLRRLAALMPKAKTADIATRLRLANSEAKRLGDLTAGKRPDLGADAPAQRRAIYQLGPALYADLILLAAAEQRRAPPPVPTTPLPRLPISGDDLLALGCPRGPAIGAGLRAVEAWWIAQDFQPDRAACLNQLASGPSGFGRQ